MKPRLLDLFCGAGGCTRGYQWAGFYVVGVDHKPQPNYCGDEFFQDDALAVLIDRLEHQGFDAVHASPPCQAYSGTQKLQGNDHPRLIVSTRELLRQTGLPYVIENVPGAPLVNPIELCGTMFELPLYRHRLFECSFPVTAPLHGQHYLKQVKMGRQPADDEIIQPVGNFANVEKGREAMSIDWMTRDELSEAVPPAYTNWIGYALTVHLNRKRVAA